MTPHPSDPGPAGDDRLPPADASAGETTQSLPVDAAPTRPLPPPAGAAGSHRIPTAEQDRSSGTETNGTGQGPNGFFPWLRSLGIVRGTDRWAGGVCSGISARLGIDPVLVRGLFVVLALFGAGLLLYGLAWAFLPEPDGRIHAEEALHGTWTTGTTGALTATILGTGPSIWWADDGIFGGFFWTLFSVAVVGLIIYWLATRSGSGGAAGTRGPSGLGAGGREPSPSSAGFGTDSRPLPPPAPARRRTSPGGAEVALILGAVLLTFGTVLSLDYISVITPEQPVAVALAAAAVVNGLAIVVLGAAGRSSGFPGLTAAALVVSAAATGTGIGSYTNVAVAHQANWAPTSSSPATGGYALAAVDGEIDLRYFSDEERPAAEVPVTVAASDLTILVPDDIPVLVRTDMLAGNVIIDDGSTVTETGSMWRSSDRRLNGTGGDPLVVHVKGFASNVLVTVNESDLER